jgi:hypothetical protein
MSAGPSLSSTACGRASAAGLQNSGSKMAASAAFVETAGPPPLRYVLYIFGSYSHLELSGEATYLGFLYSWSYPVTHIFEIILTWSYFLRSMYIFGIIHTWSYPVKSDPVKVHIWDLFMPGVIR